MFNIYVIGQAKQNPSLINSTTCCIHTDLYILNNISVLITKAHKTVGYFNHSSTICEKLKNIQVNLGSSDSMQKALLLMPGVKQS